MRPVFHTEYAMVPEKTLICTLRHSATYVPVHNRFRNSDMPAILPTNTTGDNKFGDDNENTTRMEWAVRSVRHIAMSDWEECIPRSTKRNKAGAKMNRRSLPVMTYVRRTWKMWVSSYFCRRIGMQRLRGGHQLA